MHEVVVAGGMENMSLAPHIVPMRTGVKFGGTQLEDVMQKDGLVDAFDQVAMGTYADATATKHSKYLEQIKTPLLLNRTEEVQQHGKVV